jgi:hypothetical protein
MIIFFGKKFNLIKINAQNVPADNMYFYSCGMHIIVQSRSSNLLFMYIIFYGSGRSIGIINKY